MTSMPILAASIHLSLSTDSRTSLIVRGILMNVSLPFSMTVTLRRAALLRSSSSGEPSMPPPPNGTRLHAGAAVLCRALGLASVSALAKLAMPDHAREAHGGRARELVLLLRVPGRWWRRHAGVHRLAVGTVLCRILPIATPW